MAIKPGYITNFHTMLRAAAAGHLSLMECTDVATGKPVIVVCMVSKSGDEIVMVPVAKMFDGDPYKELAPPTEPMTPGEVVPAGGVH